MIGWWMYNLMVRFCSFCFRFSIDCTWCLLVGCFTTCTNGRLFFYYSFFELYTRFEIIQLGGNGCKQKFFFNCTTCVQQFFIRRCFPLVGWFDAIPNAFTFFNSYEPCPIHRSLSHIRIYQRFQWQTTAIDFIFVCRTRFSCQPIAGNPWQSFQWCHSANEFICANDRKQTYPAVERTSKQVSKGTKECAAVCPKNHTATAPDKRAPGPTPSPHKNGREDSTALTP